MSVAAFHHKLEALEDSSRRLASTDFAAPRFYTSLLLENQVVPARNAKPFEQNLFLVDGRDILKNIKTKEGADEFETTMELATALNEICRHKDVQQQLDHINNAHVDVLASIATLTSKLTHLEESNAANDTQQGPGQQEGDEIMTDVVREEGEIFALEEMLSEKRQLLNFMQKELEELTGLTDQELMEHDSTVVGNDPEVEAEIAANRIEIENMGRKIQEQRQQEQEQTALYNRLIQESNELEVRQQDAEAITEDDASPHFEELVRLWEKVVEQHGDSTVQPKGVQEAYLKLERLLDGLERCQRHIVVLDVFQQISSTLIDNCADPNAPEFDPPRTDTVILIARTLQVLLEAGGTVSLSDLKDQISKEAVQLGGSTELGIQAVYKLVASHLIQIDRSKTPNMVSFS
ncbi:hypothetical protein EDD11_004449 [Mortierella claussenii]|nr:hypothetical protein EDD11_004449 [Mortierella claussenii]